jgi:hypothetical protein
VLADDWAAATLGDFLGAGRAAIEEPAWKPLKHTNLHPFSSNGIDFRKAAMAAGVHLLMSCKLDGWVWSIWPQCFNMYHIISVNESLVNVDD